MAEQDPEHMAQAERERVALLDTEIIKEWRSIVTLILFVAASALSPTQGCLVLPISHC